MQVMQPLLFAAVSVGIPLLILDQATSRCHACRVMIGLKRLHLPTIIVAIRVGRDAIQRDTVNTVITQNQLLCTRTGCQQTNDSC
ncbi:hypothetical protein GCK32_017825 [Trichostrongylus colubriformis]|uniref:Secreted protein n=1 Tax=Trichostrongylus colubriformis TaxID=6319 RepID=A0AAN8IYM6_TRICO